MKRRRKAVGINPVERALIVRDIERTRVRLGLSLLMATPDEDSTETLASCAYLIGMVSQACVNVMSYGDTPWLRQLHGALRTIQALCLEHSYTIPIGQALGLQRAVDLACEHMTETFANPGHTADAWVHAKWLRAVIQQHKITPDVIPDASTLFRA
jgi:hypothetical protein